MNIDNDYSNGLLSQNPPAISGRRKRCFIMTAVVTIIAASILTVYRLRPRQPLTFRRLSSSSSSSSSQGSSAACTFKILQLADLHYGENAWEDWGPEQDRKSSLAINNILSYEQDVDLVVLTGDQLTANNIDGNATAYLRMILDAMIDAKSDVQWASTFGNHDDQPREYWYTGTDGEMDVIFTDAKTSREELTKVDMSYRGSYTQQGPAEVFGTSNYHLTLMKHSAESGKMEPAARIYLFDSGGGSLKEIIDASQVEWFKEQMETYPNLPSVAFQHIPLSYDDFVYNDDDGSCTGMAEDGVSPVTSDAGLLEAMADADNFHFLSVGHNNGNDYCCKYGDATSLCFGRHSGYGGYGQWDRGARVYVLELDEEDAFSWYSYSRMESGDIVDQYYPNGNDGDGGDGGGGNDR